VKWCTDLLSLGSVGGTVGRTTSLVVSLASFEANRGGGLAGGLANFREDALQAGRRSFKGFIHGLCA
jgi:hypothetical protein